jgi:hypothetical protein
MGFSTFMASSAGRVLRVIAGTAMVVIGASLGGGWWAFTVVGLVPLLASAFDVCIFTGLLHQPSSGKALRAT